MAKNYEDLLAAVRRHLGYTWADVELDEKLTDYVQEGVRFLERIAGGNVLEFEAGSDERRLLKEYCFYANAMELDLFTPRYLHDLNSFQLDQEVKAYAAEKETNDAESTS